MKILFLITDLGRSGAERLLIDICTELKKREDIQFKIGVLYNNNQYPELTADFDIVNLDYKTFSLFKTNECPKYQELLNSFQPDVIHTHRFLAEFISSYYINPNIKYVCHGHDNMEQLRNFSIKSLFSKRKLLDFVEKRYLALHKYSQVPTNIIAISKDTFSYFKTVMPKRQRENISLIYNGFNYTAFYRKRNYDFQPKKLTITNVASFADKKNQMFIVDVAAVLRQRNIDFEINLIGVGANYEKVRSAISEKQLEKHVFLRGIQQNIQEWYAKSDIYLHSAYYEPLGLVLLEAMAAGLPVVTLDGRGNRDLIVQGKNGYMIYEQDAEQFADRILEIWNDKQKYCEMSAFAQEFAKQYDIKPYVDKLLDLYNGSDQ